MTCYKFLAIIFVISCLERFVECQDGGDPKDVSPEKLGKELKELEKLLVKKTDSEDPAVNMKIVEELIPIAESSTFMGVHNKKKLAKAEKLILSLKGLDNENMCNRKGFAIVTNVSKAIKSAGSDLERVGGLLSHYVGRQQDVCMKLYPELLEKKLATLDQAKLERLDYVMENAMNKDRLGRKGADGLFSLIRTNHVGPTLQNLYKTLTNVVNDMPDDLELKKDMKPDDLNRLVVERYLVEPCNEFIVSLAEDMFAPASTWVLIHAPGNDQYNFYYNWARYKFCSTAYKVLRT